MNNIRNIVPDALQPETAPHQSDMEMQEIASEELEQVCGGTTVGPDCGGGGGVHD